MNVIRGRTQIDSFTQNVQWTFGGEGVKGLDFFKIFVLSAFFPRIICKETLFCSFRLLYIFVVFKNFDNSDISCPRWSMMVMESTSLTTL